VEGDYPCSGEVAEGRGEERRDGVALRGDGAVAVAIDKECPVLRVRERVRTLEDAVLDPLTGEALSTAGISTPRPSSSAMPLRSVPGGGGGELIHENGHGVTWSVQVQVNSVPTSSLIHTPSISSKECCGQT
jgi:hypothetical protein